ncbi:MAG: twin-arginine translocase TatA/TatE family subunit [Bacteroidetes bacterium]|nr:MAG: twin-arginine translocase TatA/TatE family subunit [Bacteroidota bacterium]
MLFNFILLGIIGGQEILIIAIVLLILFGGKKIPELMRGLGKGIKEFKKASSMDDEETSKKTDDVSDDINDKAPEKNK